MVERLLSANFFFLRHENWRRTRQRRREKEAIDTGAAGTAGKLDFAVRRRRRRLRVYVRQYTNTHDCERARAMYRNTFPARKARRRRLSRTVKSRTARYRCGVVAGCVYNIYTYITHTLLHFLLVLLNILYAQIRVL